MVCVIKISFSINLSSIFSWEIMNFMMLVNSSAGTFEYMLSMSKEASLVFLSMEISVKSFINCIEFLTLNMFGSGMYRCRSLDSNLAILYAGAFCQMMMGLMGELVLCILGRPFILGADGLRVYALSFFVFVDCNCAAINNFQHFFFSK